jgi:hypothetical protein
VTRTKDFTGAHGTRPRYRSGCRCSDCTLANSQYVAGWVDSQRLESAEPWGIIVRSIAAQMDTTPERLMKSAGLNGRTATGILSGRYKHITPYTHSCLYKLLRLLPSEGGDA